MRSITPAIPTIPFHHSRVESVESSSNVVDSGLIVL